MTLENLITFFNFKDRTMRFSLLESTFIDLKCAGNRILNSSFCTLHFCAKNLDMLKNEDRSKKENSIQKFASHRF